jgi:hypothetical protein
MDLGKKCTDKESLEIYNVSQALEEMFERMGLSCRSAIVACAVFIMNQKLNAMETPEDYEKWSKEVAKNYENRYLNKLMLRALGPEYE